eukprot:7379989-Prymnesium_polylepis.2
MLGFPRMSLSSSTDLGGRWKALEVGYTFCAMPSVKVMTLLTFLSVERIVDNTPGYVRIQVNWAV